MYSTPQDQQWVEAANPKVGGVEPTQGRRFVVLFYF